MADRCIAASTEASGGFISGFTHSPPILISDPVCYPCPGPACHGGGRAERRASVERFHEGHERGAVIHLLLTVLAKPRYGSRAAGPGSLHHGEWVRGGGGIRVGLGGMREGYGGACVVFVLRRERVCGLGAIAPAFPPVVAPGVHVKVCVVLRLRWRAPLARWVDPMTRMVPRAIRASP